MKAPVVLFMQVICLSLISADDDHYGLAHIKGDLEVAAFFEVTQPFTSNPCHTIDVQFGYMQLAALIFATENVRRNKSLMFGHKLGIRIYDLCERRKKKLLEPLLDKVLGIIGPKYSDDAKFVSQVFQANSLPVVSYDATSVLLSNVDSFPNFFRTVPSDESLAEAMVTLALELKWKYIAVLYSYGSYGNSLATMFLQKASDMGLCVPVFRFVTERFDEMQLDIIVEEIMSNSRVNAVFWLLQDSHIPKLLQSFRRWKGIQRNVTFIGSDGWGPRLSLVRKALDVAKGGITFSFQPFYLPQFKNFMTSLHPGTSNVPLIQEFWEQVFNCTLTSEPNTKRCTGKEKIRDNKGFYNTTSVMPVINAVYAYAYMFRKAMIKLCHNESNISCLQSKKTAKRISLDTAHNLELVNIMASVKFQDPFANLTLDFDDSKVIPYGYALYNLQEIENNYQYRPIGTWTPKMNLTVADRLNPKILHGILSLDKESIEWKNGKEIPESVCSTPCNRQRGEIYVYVDQSKCCWRCRPCNENDVIVNETCVACKFDYYPDKTRRICKRVAKVPAISNNALASTVIGIIVLGSLATCTVATIFVLHRDNKEVKAMSRELSTCILLGILITYMTPTAFLLPPTEISCSIRRFLSAPGIVLIYSPLFLRLLRINRVFRQTTHITRRLHAVSPTFQIMLTIALFSVQLLIGSVWLLSETSNVRVHVIKAKRLSITHCEVRMASTVMQFMYPAVIVILCGIYGYRVRHIPKSYNESKTVALTLYLSFLIVAIFIPVLLLIPADDSYNRSYIICFTYQSLATIALVGLFGTKVKSLPNKVRIRSSLDFPSSDILSKASPSTCSRIQHHLKP